MNAVMILALDFGNTQVKAAVFEAATLLHKQQFSFDSVNLELKTFFLKFPKITKIVAVSVSKEVSEVLHPFASRVELFIIDRKTSYPFRNDYATPETLGLDRMVLAAGAVLQFPNHNRLVVDAGTCITYDFITADNRYLGGAISPGLQMRYNALHYHTAKLPLLQPLEHPKTMGDSTAHSIHSGIVNGIRYEIDGFIRDYSLENGNIIIILTGGDANFLAGHLKNPIFANPNFLLESSVVLYQYQTND